jgi:hypothetical protein
MEVSIWVLFLYGKICISYAVSFERCASSEGEEAEAGKRSGQRRGSQ